MRLTRLVKNLMRLQPQHIQTRTVSENKEKDLRHINGAGLVLLLNTVFLKDFKKRLFD